MLVTSTSLGSSRKSFSKSPKRTVGHSTRFVTSVSSLSSNSTSKPCFCSCFLTCERIDSRRFSKFAITLSFSSSFSYSAACLSTLFPELKNRCPLVSFPASTISSLMGTTSSFQSETIQRIGRMKRIRYEPQRIFFGKLS